DFYGKSHRSLICINIGPVQRRDARPKTLASPGPRIEEYRRLRVPEQPVRRKGKPSLLSGLSAALGPGLAVTLLFGRLEAFVVMVGVPDQEPSDTGCDRGHGSDPHPFDDAAF